MGYYRVMVFRSWLFLLLLWPLAAFSHPTAYKGALSLMSWNEAHTNDLWAHYSFSPRYSLGARFFRLEENEESKAAIATMSALLWRWNHREFQANAYVIGGYGGMRAGGKNGHAFYSSAELDAESRRLLAAFEFKNLLQSKGRDLYNYQLRLGMAPYLAEYDELNSWGLLQIQARQGFENKWVVTPLIGQFYKNVLWEFGSSLQGDWTLTLMVHY